MIDLILISTTLVLLGMAHAGLVGSIHHIMAHISKGCGLEPPTVPVTHKKSVNVFLFSSPFRKSSKNHVFQSCHKPDQPAEHASDAVVGSDSH